MMRMRNLGRNMAVENQNSGFDEPNFVDQTSREILKWKSISLTHVEYPQGIQIVNIYVFCSHKIRLFVNCYSPSFPTPQSTCTSRHPCFIFMNHINNDSNTPYFRSDSLQIFGRNSFVDFRLTRVVIRIYPCM